MKSVLLGLVIIGLLGGCASYKLDLNIDPSVSQNLPKDIAVKYLTEVNEKYSAPIQSVRLKPWNGNCKFSEDYWLGPDEGKFSYNSSFMSYESDVASWFQFLNVKLEGEKNGVTDWCYVVKIETHGKEHFEGSKELFLKIGKKIATALKSLGVNVESKK